EAVSSAAVSSPAAGFVRGRLRTRLSRHEIEPRAAAEPWRLRRVDIRRRNEPHLRGGADSVDLDIPPVVVDAMVTALAQEHPVDQIRRSAMSVPPPDVMHPGHLRRQSAHRAPAVALGDRQPLRPGEESLLPTPVENL